MTEGVYFRKSEFTNPAHVLAHAVPAHMRTNTGVYSHVDFKYLLCSYTNMQGTFQKTKLLVTCV